MANEQRVPSAGDIIISESGQKSRIIRIDPRTESAVGGLKMRAPGLEHINHADWNDDKGVTVEHWDGKNWWGEGVYSWARFDHYIAEGGMKYEDNSHEK